MGFKEDSDREVLQLIQDVYKAVFSKCDTFEEDDIGVDLAYILGAIATGGGCTWAPERKMLGVLRECFPEDHAVWKYVEVEDE